MGDADRRRRRADLVLMSMVAHARRPYDLYSQSADPETIQARVDAVLEICGAAGAVSDDDAAAWRERLDVKAGDRGGLSSRVDEQLKERVRALLENRLPTQGARKEKLADFFSAIAPLISTGLLPEKEAIGWLDRAYSAVGLPPASRARPERDQCATHDLRFVGVGPVETRDGLQVAWVERYPDVFLAHFVIQGGPDWFAGSPAPWRRFLDSWSVSDDLGARYEPNGSGGAVGTAVGTVSALACHQTYKPAISDDARTLTWARDTHELRVRLR